MKDILAIDVGSNTIKSLLAKNENGKIVEIDSMTLPIRISKDGKLVDDIIDKLIYAINTFIGQAKCYSEDFDIKIVATSAMRSSPEGESICNEILAATWQDIEIIDGQREAYLSMLGALSEKQVLNNEDTLFMDLGGGSLELGHFKGGKIENLKSLPLGAVKLSSMFIEDLSEKIEDDKIEAIYNHSIEVLKDYVVDNKNSTAISAGGAIAAAKVVLQDLNGKSFDEDLSLEELKFLLKEFASLSLIDRTFKFDVTEDRADIMPAAFIALIATMESLGVDKLSYVNQSLRRGICVEYYNIAF